MMKGRRSLRRACGGLLQAGIAALRWAVLAMALVSGTAILSMMVLTCSDIALRAFGRSLTGTMDLVRMAGALALACALPYTTAVKGHVAIEYFFHKLPARGRVWVDSLARSVVVALFALLGLESLQYAQRLRASGEVSPTLQIPIFWIPSVMALSFFLVALVVLYNLTHPGREMIKP